MHFFNSLLVRWIVNCEFLCKNEKNHYDLSRFVAWWVIDNQNQSILKLRYDTMRYDTIRNSVKRCVYVVRYVYHQSCICHTNSRDLCVECGLPVSMHSNVQKWRKRNCQTVRVIYGLFHRKLKFWFVSCIISDQIGYCYYTKLAHWNGFILFFFSFTLASVGNWQKNKTEQTLPFWFENNFHIICSRETINNPNRLNNQIKWTGSCMNG